MGEFLSFKRMITPIIIQVVFWIAVVLIIIGGLITIVGGLLQLGSREPVAGLGTALGGLLIIIFGPLVARVYAEVLMVLFRINETLTDISESLSKTTPPRQA